MDNSNLDVQCLGRRQLRLSKRGNGLFIRNLLNFINSHSTTYPLSNEKDNYRQLIDRQDDSNVSNSNLHNITERFPSDEHTSSFEDLHRLRTQ